MPAAFRALPDDDLHVPVEIPARDRPGPRRPRDRAARTLLHHIVNGTDLVDEQGRFVELRVRISHETFDYLCMVDADDDADLEETADREPDTDDEPDQHAPWNERAVNALPVEWTWWRQPLRR